MRDGKKYGGFLEEHEEDPMAGLANLFDVSMVFALALMVALVSRLHMNEFFSEREFTMVKNPGKENMEIIQKKEGKIIKYESKNQRSEQRDGDQGKRVGSAFQLESGEIIYIPE